MIQALVFCVVLVLAEQAGAQAIALTGKVVDGKGNPVVGASVRLLGRTLASTTAADGGFDLKGSAAIRSTVPEYGSANRFADRGVPRFRIDGRIGDARLAWLFTYASDPYAREGDAEPVARPAGLAKSTQASSAAVDTLEVRASGFIRKLSPLQSYSGNLSVTLAPQLRDPELAYAAYVPKPTDRILSRSDYLRRLHGLWLAESMANWTGLVTEMDKIQPPFYTRADWGKRDQKSIWGVWGPNPDTLIDYTFTKQGTPWGADDDTDLEYMYQHLMDTDNVSILSPTQIQAGWLRHIKVQEENYLWVSNQRAFDLMRGGMLPPETSLPKNNPDYDMIDAQLTTEIFGAFAPARPDVAARMAELPIRTTAYGPAALIANFYVRMYSLASAAPAELTMKEKTRWLASQARATLPDTSYPAKMYDYVYGRVTAGVPAWETVRDELHVRYQVNHADGYDVTARPGIVCQGCFAAGINFASSLVSLFYGEGDLPKTIQVASLCGWDSDNPTATWGGLFGLLLGKDGVEAAFGRTDLSDTFWIHRTRQNFPDRTPNDAGEDSFPMMAERGVRIIDRVVLEEMHGGVDPERDVWYIPAP